MKRAAVKGFDAGRCDPPLALGRHRIDHRSLETHQFRPLDAGAIRTDATALPPPDPLDRLRSADEDLLRIAAAQRARAAERPGVDDGYIHPAAAAPCGHA
jgi:hypothetical protein